MASLPTRTSGPASLKARKATPAGGVFLEAGPRGGARATAPDHVRDEVSSGRTIFYSYSASDAASLLRVTSLLGGDKVFVGRVNTPMEAHDVLAAGLPGRAVWTLVSSFVHLDRASNSVTSALGMSLRTFQRWKDTPTRRLSVEQSGRAWKFAEVLARATEVFGGQAEAEQWLEQPATGLDQRRPIDLLGTPAGVELVEAHLTRLEYGVYA